MFKFEVEIDNAFELESFMKFLQDTGKRITISTAKAEKVLRQITDLSARTQNCISCVYYDYIERKLMDESGGSLGGPDLNKMAREYKSQHPVTIDFLCSLTESEWLKHPNFGRKSLNEIKVLAAEYGRHIGDRAS